MRGLLMLASLGLSLYLMSRLGDPIAGAWTCSPVRGTASNSRPAEPGLELSPDHTYQWGRQTGTWQYSRGELRFSHQRAIGRLSPDGRLVTEYDRNGEHYVLTFYKWR